MRLIAPVLRWAKPIQRTKETFEVQPRRNVLLLRLDQREHYHRETRMYSYKDSV